ncbi:glycoside hydrolase [Candidatus Pacearchaeota archaeon]|nr:glycoside hydrolase [Candidatus Pacearchaeota archaeon]
MKVDDERLFTEAKSILEKNWRGSNTVPSPYLYPHQWNWDSGFIAIGYSHFNQGRAQKEILSLFEGQWKNGMLPHIIFRSNGSYFPNPEFWQTNLSKDSPKIKTSGITQPPVHAIAALYIYKNAKNKGKALSFLKDLYPRIKAFHKYLLTERDPENSGLVTVFHPWESGFDNSVRWDNALKRVKVMDLPGYRRVDNKKVSSEQRPTKESYDKYVYLIEIMKKHNYNIKKIYPLIPFKLKDIVFSSILYVANKSLIEIAELIGENHEEIDGWINKTKDNYFQYFCAGDEEYRLAYDYDVIIKKNVIKRTVASLIPIYTGLLSRDEAEGIFSYMKHSHFCKENCTHKHPVVTSMSVDEAEFNPLNYWRGPIWININWMLYKGLINYNFDEEAETLRKAVLELVSEHGFYEYYNPLTGEGLGTDNFSWTAAMVIDLIKGGENGR